MKGPQSVLHQKDLDLEQVREEIQALLTVIPLLAAISFSGGSTFVGKERPGYPQTHPDHSRCCGSNCKVTS